MSQRPTKVLLIEDNPGDCRLIEEMLAPGDAFEFEWVTTLSAGLERLSAAAADVALLDLGLPDSQGLESLAQLREQVPGLPVVVLTGLADDALGNEAVRQGAQDYLVKGQVDAPLLTRSLGYAVERARQEKSLRDSEAKNRALLWALPDMMLRIRADGTYLEFIPAKGFEPWVPAGEFLGKTVAGVMPPENARHTLEDIGRALDTGDLQTREYTLPARGELRHYEYRMVPSGPDEVLTVVRDITEAKQEHRDLTAVRDRLQLSIDRMPIAYVLWDHAGKVTHWNPAAERIFGYSSEEAVGESLLTLVVPEDARPAVGDVIGALVEGRDAYYSEPDNNIRKDGTIISCRWFNTPIGTASDRVLSMALDVTEEQGVREELLASRTRLRALAQRLNAAREAELTAVSREIHDQLGQALTGLRMDASWVAARLPDDDGKLAARLDSILALADEATDTVRNIAASLRPAVLDDIGIEAAIEWHTVGFAKRAGLECGLDLRGGDVALDAECATAAFRILQEALTNVGRHADARRVEVSLGYRNEHLILEVRDDGRGISTEELGAIRSLGLLGMEERALAVGGELRVEAVPEGGTRVTLTLPQQAPRNDR